MLKMLFNENRRSVFGLSVPSPPLEIMPALPETHVPENHNSNCYACGSENAVGLKISFRIDVDGCAHGIWHPHWEFQSYPDRVHGGIIATLVDSSMVQALRAREVVGITAEMTVRYLKPANLFDPIRVRAWVDSSHHGLHHCQSVVWQSGCQIARGNAKFMTKDGVNRTEDSVASNGPPLDRNPHTD